MYVYTLLIHTTSSKVMIMRNQTEKTCESKTEIEDKREKLHVSNIPKKQITVFLTLHYVFTCVYVGIAIKKKAVLSVLEDIY